MHILRNVRETHCYTIPLHFIFEEKIECNFHWWNVDMRILNTNNNQLLQNECEYSNKNVFLPFTYQYN